MRVFSHTKKPMTDNNIEELGMPSPADRARRTKTARPLTAADGSGHLAATPAGR